MRGNCTGHNKEFNDKPAVFSLGAISLFIATVVIIFVAEATVMMLLYFLDLPQGFSTGIVDATLLSILVAPSLYFTFLKPMRESYFKRDQSEEKKRHLEEIDKMKSDFISAVTHELRTPVSTIMGYSEIVLNNLKPDKNEEFINIIFKKSETLDRLIDDLEVVNQLEFVKNLQLKQTKNDLRETVSHVIDIHKHKTPEIPIILNLPKSPQILAYDEVRICQVLDNLLSNAVKYSSGHQDKIEVSISDNQDHIVITVKDNGVGMDKEEICNMFNMFYRAETKKDIVGGLGLGMSIVKNIVKSHDGMIDVVSQRNAGTVVSVALPKRVESEGPNFKMEEQKTEIVSQIQKRIMALA